MKKNVLCVLDELTQSNPVLLQTLKDTNHFSLLLSDKKAKIQDAIKKKKYNKIYLALDWQGKISGKDLDFVYVDTFRQKIDVEFIITMFLRYDALQELLESIEKFYPDVVIRIADQSGKFFQQAFYEKWTKRLNIIVHKLPFDVGLSYARNYLVDNATNNRLLLLEEDFIFTKDTKIEKMNALMDDTVGIVGGLCIADDNEQHYEGEITVDNGVCRFKADKNEIKTVKGIKVKQTKCVLNFALFNREIFKFIRWRDELKICEHSAFYIDYDKNRLLHKILYTPEVKILHSRKRDVNYVQYRKRWEEFLKVFFNIYGIRKHIGVDGKVKRLRGNKIICL